MTESALLLRDSVIAFHVVVRAGEYQARRGRVCDPFRAQRAQDRVIQRIRECSIEEIKEAAFEIGMDALDYAIHAQLTMEGAEHAEPTHH